MTEKTPKDDKAARLSQALRANLKRRKQAARKAAPNKSGKPVPPQT